MYEVQILNRGPEGVRNNTKYLITEAGSDELLKRHEAGAKMEDILAGIELQPVEQPAAPQLAEGKTARGKRNAGAPKSPKS